MILHHVRLYNFRCFQERVFTLSAPVVLITGVNGSGKTSLLEALHYGCYLRSFRTHILRDLMYEQAEVLALKMELTHAGGETYQIHIGLSDKKRVIKINQQEIPSYQALLDTYRAITLTEDDMDIISGGPEVRRLFLDHLVLLHNPSFGLMLRTFRTVLAQRNALLAHPTVDHQQFLLWTSRLWEITQHIQQERRTVLAALLAHVQGLIDEWSFSLSVQGEYKPKWQEGKEMPSANSALFGQERKWKRSLFGAHLDDIQFTFNQKLARSFASRGQKKLMVFLLKAAQAAYLSQQGKPVILLLDDFMTDFDEATARKLFSGLRTLFSQIIITAPHQEGILAILPSGVSLQHIALGAESSSNG